jgi:UDP-N-acetylmuramyl tripeptide synthase
MGSKKKVSQLHAGDEAIKTALCWTSVILLLLQGMHEPYQEIMGVKHHFDVSGSVKGLFESNNELRCCINC